MKHSEESVKTFYLTDEYILKNPTLHVEDSSWKVSKITPLLDEFIDLHEADSLNLLDVGGGAGMVLAEVGGYLESAGLKVNKYAVDLSPQMLEIQKKRNPDLKNILEEDICKTSLGDKAINLALLIDVLEHVYDPAAALKEVRRIADYFILKVPLENNLTLNLLNLASGGRVRESLIGSIGHIHSYHSYSLRRLVSKHGGRIIDCRFTGVCDYFKSSAFYYKKWSSQERWANLLARQIFKVSPTFCSLLFTDFLVLLVKCD